MDTLWLIIGCCGTLFLFLVVGGIVISRLDRYPTHSGVHSENDLIPPEGGKPGPYRRVRIWRIGAAPPIEEELEGEPPEKGPPPKGKPKR
jgi:hypothetical protein